MPQIQKNFIKRIKDNLSLNIRCIDGKSESYLGGLAALNLLSPFKDGTTLDIGGGSSELCLIKIIELFLAYLLILALLG